jgi:hypothetical protein
VAILEFTEATPKELKGFADFLSAFTKRGVEKKEHEMIWQRTSALSVGNMSRLLYSENTVNLLKKELKKSTSITFDDEAVKTSIRNCLESAMNVDLLKYKVNKEKKSATE